MKKFIIPMSIIAAGVAGFFVGKTVAKKDEERRIQEAVNNYKESYQKRRKEIADYITKCNEEGKSVTVVAEGDLKFNKDKEEYPEESDEDHQREVRIISENEYLKGEMLKEFKEKRARAERKANKYSRKHIDYDPKDEYYEDELDEDGNPPAPSEGDSIYPITYEEYANQNIHFDKQSVIYYEENDIIVYDETDECILEDVMLFGTDDWRDLLEETGTAYIRNERLSTDFEIILKKGAYVE